MNPFDSVNELLKDIKIEKQNKLRAEKHAKDNKYWYRNRDLNRIPIVGNSSISSNSVYRIKSIPTEEIDDQRIMNCNFHLTNISCEPWNPAQEWCIATHFDEQDYFAINSFQQDVWNDTLILMKNISTKLDVNYDNNCSKAQCQSLSINYVFNDSKDVYLSSAVGLLMEKYDCLIYAHFKNKRAFLALKIVMVVLIRRAYEGDTFVCDVHDTKMLNVRKDTYEVHGCLHSNCRDCLFIEVFPLMASIFTIAGLPITWFASNNKLLESASDVLSIFGFTLAEFQTHASDRESSILVDSITALLYLSTMDGLVVKQNTSQLARFDFKNATKVVISAINSMLSIYGSQLKYVSYADRHMNPKRNKLVVAIPFNGGCSSAILRKMITATNVIFMGALLRTGACSFHFYELVTASPNVQTILGGKVINAKCTSTSNVQLKRSEFFLSTKMYKVILFNWSTNDVTSFTEPRDPSSHISYINIKIDYLTGDLSMHFINTMSDFIFSVFRDHIREYQRESTFYKRTDTESRLIFKVADEQCDLCAVIKNMLSNELKSGDEGYVYSALVYTSNKFRKSLVSSKIPQELIVNVTVVYSGDNSIQHVPNSVNVFIMETEIVKFDTSLLNNQPHCIDIDSN